MTSVKYKISFLGLGISTYGALRFLLKNRPAPVDDKRPRFFVSEKNAEVPGEKKDFLHQHGIAYELGKNSDELLNTKLLIISPSVRPDNHIIQKALAKGVRVATDIELFLEALHKKRFSKRPALVAITGTNGKTTTVEILRTLLSNGKWAYPAGNIGVSPFDLLDKDLNGSSIIFELSSFQLHYMPDDKRPFDIAGITNITRDHLDWHGDFERYKADKLKILKLTEKAVVPSELADRDTYTFGFGSDDCVLDASKKLINTTINGRENTISLERFKATGTHNQKNAALAIYIAFLLQKSPELIQKRLAQFVPGEHRMERFLNRKGVVFINDSKSTNADSLQWGLKSFEDVNPPLRLMAGGRDKHDDYTTVGALIDRTVTKCYLCGESAERLADQIHDTEKVIFSSWSEAIEKVIDESESGDTVLFSPGGSSFDRFRNYRERGNYFKKTVKELLETHKTDL